MDKLIQLISAVQKEGGFEISVQIDKEMYHYFAKVTHHDIGNALNFEPDITTLLFLDLAAVKRLLILMSRISRGETIEFPAELSPGGIPIPKYPFKNE